MKIFVHMARTFNAFYIFFLSLSGAKIQAAHRTRISNLFLRSFARGLVWGCWALPHLVTRSVLRIIIIIAEVSMPAAIAQHQREKLKPKRRMMSCRVCVGLNETPLKTWKKKLERKNDEDEIFFFIFLSHSLCWLLRENDCAGGRILCFPAPPFLPWQLNIFSIF